MCRPYPRWESGTNHVLEVGAIAIHIHFFMTLAVTNWPLPSMTFATKNKGKLHASLKCHHSPAPLTPTPRVTF